LSYTTFAIDAPTPDCTELTVGQTLRVSVTVANTGERAGAEVVQLYVGNPGGPVPRPVRELRDFAKIPLQPGETRVVEFTLGPRAFAYWDTAVSGWRIEPGHYTLQAGASSRALSPAVTVRLV
jgi:beta-glucosidase